MKALATYILRGHIQAAGIIGLFGALGWIFPLSFLLSCAAAGLVVLRKGPKDAAIALTGAALFCMVVALVRFGTPTLALLNVLVFWLPVCLCAQVLRVTRSQTVVLIVVIAMSLILATGLRYFSGGIEDFWQNSLTKYASKVAIIGNTSDAEKQAEVIIVLAIIMNGFVAASFGLMTMLSVLLARWWQSLLFNPGGFGEEFRRIQLPAWITISVIVTAILIGLVKLPVPPYGWLLDCLIIGTALLMFHGLSIVHYFVNERQSGTGWMAGLYFFLIVTSVYVFSLLVILAIMDSLSDYRKLRSKAA